MHLLVSRDALTPPVFFCYRDLLEVLLGAAIIMGLGAQRGRFKWKVHTLGEVFWVPWQWGFPCAREDEGD